MDRVRRVIRFVAVFVLAGGLSPVLSLPEAETLHSDEGGHEETHQTGGHSNHELAVQREAPFEYHSDDQDIAYSLFMHHSSGGIMLALGLLLLFDRRSLFNKNFLRIMIGCTWMLLGMFVFIYSDLEGWPVGPATFAKSFDMPTTNEWVQHKLLSLIPMVMGVYSLTTRRGPPVIAWKYVVAGISLFGGIALLVHQHEDHPGMDIVNLQHRIFALTVFFIASGVLAEQWHTISWKAKPYLVPIGVILLGIQLVAYVE